MLCTKRLSLRPWTVSDAKALYKYAKDTQVGHVAGWPPHTDIENSRQIIRDVLSAEETYAAVLRETGEPVGSVGIMLPPRATHTFMGGNDAEIGYWIGVSYWGQGLIPEAANELIRHGFEDLGFSAIWCGYYAGNEQSRRVQEKCGFVYHHTEYDAPCPMIDERRTEHFTVLAKQEWQELKDHKR